MVRYRVHIGLALMLNLVLAMPVAAQVTTANVDGTVRDDTGAMLPGTTVTIVNEETGLQRVAVTSDTGRFRLPSLPPGSYEVRAEVPGFQNERRTGLVLRMAQSVFLEFTLKVAPVEEQVTVTAVTPLVDVTKSSIGQVVDNIQIDNLPIPERSFQQLALLVPGARKAIFNARRRGPFKEIAFNAGSGRMTHVTLDGGDISDIGVGWVNLGVPLDAIQEFQVVSNRFTADSGRSNTGVISVVTRSGTNNLQGSAYGFFREKALNGRDHFLPADVPKPDFSRRQFGGTVGGPIKSDRAHFFLAVERLNEATNVVVNTLGNFPQFEESVPLPYELTLVTTRFDAQHTDSHSVFLRYAMHNSYQKSNVGGKAAATAGSESTNQTHDVVVGSTWVISDKALNEFRVHYGNFFQREEPLSREPRLEYNNLSLGWNTLDPQGAQNRRLQFRNDFSYFTGDHSLKFGADVTDGRVDAPFFPTAGGRFSFAHNNYPFNADDPETWPYRYELGFGDGYWQDNNFQFLGFYAQDDWTPRANLTLNLGMRWEAETTAAMEGGQLNAFTPYKEGDTEVDWNNFGPRLGFVWAPQGGDRFVIRGGYGIFYFRTFTNPLQNAKSFDGVTYKNITVDNDPPRPDFFTNPLGGRTREEYVSTAPFDTRLIAPDYKTPYTHQTSLGFQAQMGADLSLSVDYVNSLGRDEGRARDLNIFGSNGGQTGRDEWGIPIPRPYPQFRRVLQYETTSRSTYNGINTSLRKRFSNNYQFGVAYTLGWARGLTEAGFGSQPNDETNPEADYGYQRNDQRHSLSINGVFNLPHEFQLSPLLYYGSGRPFTAILSGVDLNNDRRTNDRAPGFERNSERGAYNLSFDIRVGRDFALGGDARLQLMLEIYNITNHANFIESQYDNNVRSATFGQPQQALEPRQMQLAIRFTF